MIESILAQHDFTLVEDPRPEGPSTVASVMTRSGETALLYVMPTELTALRAAEAHRRLGAQLFAVPELIDSGPRWVLIHHPGGVPLSSVGGWSGRDASAYATSLGQVVRKLHESPCESFCGDLLEPDEGGQRWLTFSGYAAHLLEWFSENLRTREFGEAETASLTRAIGDLRHELSAFHPRNPPSMCHGRLAAEHVWVEAGGREIAGITGFGYAAQVPRESDIAYLLWIAGLPESLIRRFYEGYGSARTMDVQRRERFYRRLVALQALFDAKGEVPVSTERLIELTSPVVA